MNNNQICKSTQEIAKKAGEYIKRSRLSFTDSDVNTKGTHDLVSFVDKTAEKMIVADLQKLMPKAGILAEEGTGEQTNSDLFWIIDPLDGTTNFISNLYPYAVSIALRKNNETVIGVVYEIGKDECFFAYKGSPAFLNNIEIKVNNKTSLNDSLIATGFPYNDYSKQEQYLETLSYFMQNTRGIRRFGSAATDLVYFACGRFDAFFEYSLKPWDVAAGAFIAKQAGGVVSDFSGGNDFLFGQEIIAASPEIFESFIEALRKRFL